LYALWLEVTRDFSLLVPGGCPVNKEAVETAKHRLVIAIVSIFVTGAVVLFGLYTYYGFSSGIWQKQLDEHFSVLVVLPFGALFAFVVVMVFRATSGAIEFEVVGLRFKGASGPIILWCMAFMSIVAAVRILW